MTPEDLDDIMHIIRFPGMTPAALSELPAGVATWLMPARMALDRIERDARKPQRRS